jgi:hypothetical protein
MYSCLSLTLFLFYVSLPISLLSVSSPLPLPLRLSSEGLEAIPTADPLPRSKQIVMDKMIQVTDLLEKRTRELEERLHTVEVKITLLTLTSLLEWLA